MELPHIGLSCSVCNRNDYLPFKCSRCDKIVCVDHKTNHGSECPLQQTSFSSVDSGTESTKSLKEACDFCKKITLKLELVRCQQCELNLCLYHRHQVQHNCSKLAEDSEIYKKERAKQAEIKQLALDQLRDNTKPIKSNLAETNVATPKRFIDPKKQALARRIRVMKIKQFAKGPPNVLSEDKIFFEVTFQHNSNSDLSDPKKDRSSIKIFTTGRHTVGRMIDWVADELKLVNKNHIENASQLVFQTPNSEGEPTILDSQQTFSFYLDDSSLFSGDEIIIKYS